MDDLRPPIRNSKKSKKRTTNSHSELFCDTLPKEDKKQETDPPNNKVWWGMSQGKGNNAQAKDLVSAASTTSPKSDQLDLINPQREDNSSSQAINEILSIDSGSPWDRYNYKTFKNGRPRRMDTVKSFWVNSEAAYAEMEQLRIRSLVNTVDYSDDDKDTTPETSFWKIFATSEPASPKDKDLSEYPTLFATNKEEEEKKEEYQSSQNNEISQKEESGSQDFTDSVDTREAQDSIKYEQNTTEDQPINISNVIEQSSKNEFKLSNMVKPINPQANRLKLSDLVEQPPEGFTLKLSDLINPQKRR